jgi:multicomponent Na+:H+ antiporter subunit E
MTPLGLNLLLAVVWCLITGAFTPWNFVAGMGIGALIVSGMQVGVGRTPYIVRIAQLARFGVYFVRILVQSNWVVAKAAMHPGMVMRPRIIRYAVDRYTPGQRLALSSAITLTPGTLSVDISPDGKWLYLHCMFAESRDQAIADIDELAAKMRKWVFAC